MDDVNPEKLPRVAVLIATYNGETFLQEQLESIARQVGVHWALYASDDGSIDRTKDIITQFAANHPSHIVKWINGPRGGFAKNFLSLVCNPDLEAQYFSYADQDDVWLDDKLLRATKYLSQIPSDIPALYCSRTEYVNSRLKHIGYSTKYLRPTIFRNALVQNIASGNTMTFNQAARKLIQITGADVNIPLHDWWTYILVSGVNGKTFLDLSPTVLYRQHEGNLWGMNAGWKARFVRIKKLLEGRFQSWNERHVNEIMRAHKIFRPENLATVRIFEAGRRAPNVFQRFLYLHKSGIYRQTLIANIGLIIAAVLNKI